MLKNFNLKQVLGMKENVESSSQGEKEADTIKKEFDTIFELCNQCKDEYCSKFFAPASEEQVQKWEMEHKIALPKLYKEWLSFSDGAIIRGNLARIYGINGIETSNPNYPEDFVIIGEVIGDGERLAFSKTSGKILRVNHGQIREYNDFAMFLNKMIIRMMSA